MYYIHELSKKVGKVKPTYVLWQDFLLLVGFESLNQKSMALMGLRIIMNLWWKLCVTPFPLHEGIWHKQQYSLRCSQCAAEPMLEGFFHFSFITDITCRRLSAITNTKSGQPRLDLAGFWNSPPPLLMKKICLWPRHWSTKSTVRGCCLFLCYLLPLRKVWLCHLCHSDRCRLLSDSFLASSSSC